jgi:hypothetical protein
VRYKNIEPRYRFIIFAGKPKGGEIDPLSAKPSPLPIELDKTKYFEITLFYFISKQSYYITRFTVNAE